MLPQPDPANKTTAPRLFVDAMLGRLARWLRLLGYDAAYWRAGSDDELIAAARAEGRLIVTRDHPLAGRRGVAAILIESEQLDEQIAEARALLVSQPLPAPFSRCPECNGMLADLPHEEARDLVPAYVWHTQHRFRRCTECGRVYWPGTHFPDLRARIE
jgi:uncharacterized protein